jgi:hypothetical protein
VRLPQWNVSNRALDGREAVAAAGGRLHDSRCWGRGIHRAEIDD